VRFMVMVRPTKQSEAGLMPDRKLLEAIGKYNEELVKAGALLADEGLQPSSKGRASGFRETHGPSSTGRSRRPRS